MTKDNQDVAGAVRRTPRPAPMIYGTTHTDPVGTVREHDDGTTAVKVSMGDDSTKGQYVWCLMTCKLEVRWLHHYDVAEWAILGTDPTELEQIEDALDDFQVHDSDGPVPNVPLPERVRVLRTEWTAAVAERDLAVWLHAESEWWLGQYKHDVVLWRQQVTATEGERDAARAEVEELSRENRRLHRQVGRLPYRQRDYERARLELRKLNDAMARKNRIITKRVEERDLARFRRDEVVAELAAQLPRLAELAEQTGKAQTAEWLRTCATLPPNQWPPAPAYKGPMVPAAERDRQLADIEQFVANVQADRESSCWTWTAAKDRNGYGRIKFRGRKWFAHRVSYTLFRGELAELDADGNRMVIDHLCRNRGCVNPGHLRLVTNRENLVAEGSLSPTKLLSERTHCPRGHALTSPNLRPGPLRRGLRSCLACARGLNNVRDARIKRGVNLDPQATTDAHYARIMTSQPAEPTGEVNRG